MCARMSCRALRLATRARSVIFPMAMHTQELTMMLTAERHRWVSPVYSRTAPAASLYLAWLALRPFGPAAEEDGARETITDRFNRENEQRAARLICTELRGGNENRYESIEQTALRFTLTSSSLLLLAVFFLPEHVCVPPFPREPF